MSDPEYVTDETPRPYTLADGLELKAYANTTDPLRPVRYEAVYAPADRKEPLPLVSFTPVAGGFDAATERERIASQLATLYPGEADRETVEEGVADAIEDLGDDVAAGDVIITDERGRELIEATTAVRFDSDAEEWTITFSDHVKTTATFGKTSARLSAGDFAAGAAPSSVNSAVPGEISMTPFGSRMQRWNEVRSAWIRMAAADEEGDNDD